LNMLITQFKNEYADEGITFIPIHPGYVCSFKGRING